MSDQERYKQVLLAAGPLRRTCWLPAAAARVGRRVRIKGEAATWSVLESYDLELPRAALRTDWRVGGLL